MRVVDLSQYKIWTVEELEAVFPPPPVPSRRQADGGIVGFAPRSRQRPSPSRSTTPRLANRPSRIETALLSQWVAFAHWTTPASGWSRSL